LGSRVVLGIKPRASEMLGKHTTTWPHLCLVLRESYWHKRLCKSSVGSQPPCNNSIRLGSIWHKWTLANYRNQVPVK
jgi:hypothetical protein